MTFGALCLLPPLVVIVLAILIRRAFEPLLIGCLVGFVLIKPTDFPGNFIEALKKSLQHEDMVWIILVCGLYGSLIHLIIQSGGVFAFGNYVLKYVKSRRSALLTTWFLGIFIFIDDYMSALATGVTMRKITDNYRISREMLAFQVNAMAAPICVLIPMSTWSIYVGKLLEDNKVVAAGDGFSGFLMIIPFMFYPWAVVIVALLVALGKFPLFNKLKMAEKRALETGVLSPPNSVKAAISEVPSDLSKAQPIYFFLPLLVVIAATLLLQKDALKGVLVGVSFTFFYYWLSGVMKFTDITDGIFEGFKSMVFALAILTMSYVLKRVGDEMGLTQFVIESVKPHLSKGLLPMALFLSLSFISYTTASSWGLYAVAIPIIIPLTQALGGNVWVSLAAVISSGAFGSHSSFYSDVTVLTSSSTECNNMELSLAALPFNLVSMAIAALLFLGCGFYF
jgi:tetracycline resistance efflux pump